MILGSVFAEGHSNNSFFREDNPIHRFYPTFTNRLLREEFRRKGVEINTADVNAGRPVDFELHFEGRALQPGEVPRFLVALENPFINPCNADPEYLAGFRRVFSWNTRFAHLPNFMEVFPPNRFVTPRWLAYEERKIFSCLINANKGFKTEPPNDLYSERIAVIRWYERNAPRHFELYGLGWGKPRHESGITGRIKRRAQRLATQLFGYRPFPSWKGELADKSSVLLSAKFAYCYENVYGLSGYVTEKIFDSLMYGCVPVYWGADDIGSRIPPDCFVDRRNFRDTEAVHAHLLSISAREHARKQQAAREFLGNGSAQKYSSEYFVRTIVEEVVAEMGGTEMATRETIARNQQAGSRT
jgi:alpha(1,3/1,4) fucosyltransferase